MFTNQYLMFIIFMTFMNLFLYKKQVFMILLWFEMILLMFIFGMVMLPFMNSNMLGVIIIFTLTMAVCEASVALAALVLLSRNSSNLSIKSLSPLKC